VLVTYTFVVLLLAALTPEQRSQHARLAALARWAREDPTCNALRGQRGFLKTFEDQIRSEFPHLDDRKVLRRAECLRRAHMARMAFKASKARTAAAEARRRSGPEEAA
jgi:hypothetical protein